MRWLAALGSGVPPALVVLLAASLCWAGDEDAFIYYRFAVNAAHGLGLVFNPGQPVEGYSSPIWMLLLALGAATPIAVDVLARALGVLCGAATVAAVGWLGSAAGLGRGPRLAAQLSLALNYYFLVWSQSGLETPLFMLLLTVSAAAYLRMEYPVVPAGQESPPARARLVGGLLLGLTALGRPEGAALALLVFLDRARQRAWGALLLYAAGAGALVLPYVGWRHAYFGAWLPNTSIKVYPLHLFDRSLPQAAGFLGYLGVLVLLVPPLWWRWGRAEAGDRTRLGRLWLAGVAVAFGFHFMAGGDYRPGFRYLLAPLPLLLVAGWGSLENWLAAAGRRPRALVMAVLAASLVLPSAVLWWRDPSKRVVPREIGDHWSRQLATETDPEGSGNDALRWILHNVPDGAVVAYGQMGELPYLTLLSGRDVRFLDTVGLVDRQVATLYRFDRKLVRVLRAAGRGEKPAEALARIRAENASAFVEQILRRRPAFVLAEANLEHAGLAALVDNPEFRARYDLVTRLGPPPHVEVFAPRARVEKRTFRLLSALGSN